VTYPDRPVLNVLPQFVGTAGIKQTPQQRLQLRTFVAEQYTAGLSLRALAELSGRSQTAVRRALDESGTKRRQPGAPAIATTRR
jgi:hypothetical protein